MTYSFRISLFKVTLASVAHKSLTLVLASALKCVLQKQDMDIRRFRKIDDRTLLLTILITSRIAKYFSVKSPASVRGASQSQLVGCGPYGALAPACITRQSEGEYFPQVIILATRQTHVAVLRDTINEFVISSNQFIEVLSPFQYPKFVPPMNMYL